MNYREAYAAYHAAKKAVPGLQARIQALEPQLESARNRQLVTSGARKYFADRAEGLESRKSGYLESLKEERQRMAGSFASRAGISFDEFQSPRKPVIPESMEEIEALGKTRPQYYQFCMDVIKQLDRAEKEAARRRAGTPQEHPEPRTPFEEYQEARQRLNTMDREHAREMAELEAPQSLAAMEELAAMEDFPRDVLESVESRVNALLSADGGRTLESLRQERQALQERQQELRRLDATGNLSLHLTSLDTIDRLEPDTAEVMKQTLDGLMGDSRDSLGPDGIRTVNDLLEEETQLKKAKLELEQLKREEADGLLRKGFSLRRGGFNFTELNEMEPYEKQRREMELNRRITAYTQENTPPADGAAAAYFASVQAGDPQGTPLELYYASVEKAQQARKRYEEAERAMEDFTPENPVRLEAHGDRWSGIPEIRSQLEAYRNAREAREAIYVSANPLPETFTDLYKVEDPVRRKCLEERIDRLIQDNPDRQPPNSLAEYYAMQQALPPEMKNSVGLALPTGQLRKLAGTSQQAQQVNQFAAAKERIKDLVRADNAAKKRMRKSGGEEAAQKEADRVLQSAKEALEVAKSSYLEQLKTGAKDLQEASGEIKAFIKKTVIPGPVKKKEAEVNALESSHREHKKQMEQLIRSYNGSRLPSPAAGEAHRGDLARAGAEALRKEVKEKTAAYEAACARADKLLAEQRKKDPQRAKAATAADARYRKERETWQAVVDTQAGRLEKLIKAGNENSRRQRSQVERVTDQAREYIESYDSLATAQTYQYRQQKLAQKKSACRTAYMSKLLLGTVKNAMDYLNEGFFRMASSLSEAAIRAEALDAGEKQREAEKKLQDIREAQMRATTVASGQYEEEKARPADAARSRQTGMDQLASRLEKLDQADAAAAQALQELYACNRQLTQVRESMGDRIRENREALDGGFRSAASPDVEEQAVSQMVHAISLEAAGNSPLNQELARARERLDSRQLETLMKEDAAAAAAMEERIRSIESASQTLAPLFQEQSLSRIDAIVDISQRAVNCLIGHLNQAAGQEDPIEPIDIRGKMAELKEKIQNKQEEHAPVALEFVELAKVMYTEGFQKVKEQLDALYQKKEEAFAAAESGYLDFMEEEQQFNAFLSSVSPESLGTNRLDAWNAFYDQAEQTAVGMLDDQIRWAESGRDIAREREAQAAGEADTLHERLEEQKQLLEEARKTREDAREHSTRQAFYQTVLENADQPRNPVVLTRSDLFAENQGEFALLEKLTGVAFSRDMEIEKAMDAFGSIQINGLNAVAWFDLYEPWDKVYQGSPESQETRTAKKELFDNLARYESQIREALKVPFDGTRRQGLEEGARRLEGQMIAVENSRLGLSALELKPDRREEPPRKPEKPVLAEHVEKGLFKDRKNKEIDQANQALQQAYDSSMAAYQEHMTRYRETYKGIDSYNRNSRMTADAFQEMRVEAARTELGKPMSQETRKKVSFSELDKEEKLAYAVRKSRNPYSRPKEIPMPERQKEGRERSTGAPGRGKI